MPGTDLGDEIFVRVDQGVGFDGESWQVPSVDFVWDNGERNCVSSDEADASLTVTHKNARLDWTSGCGEVNLTWTALVPMETVRLREDIGECLVISQNSFTESARVTGSVAGVAVDVSGSEFLINTDWSKQVRCK